MADDTLQYGTADTISTDHLTNLNGTPITPGPTTPKAQRVKVGYGDDGVFRDVSSLFPLPVGPGTSALITQTINSLNPTAQIDTAGYSWATVQMSAGYVGMTSLTAQVSNDGATWFSWAMAGAGDTSSGINSSLGTAAKQWHGPIPGRFIRFNPAGAFSSGSCVLQIYLTSTPLVLNTQGANANVTNRIAPSYTIGTASGNVFQLRTTGTGTVSATQLLAGVSSLTIYVTDISWANFGAGAADTMLSLIAASSASGGEDLVLKANQSDTRTFLTPWKISTTTNIALNYAISTASTTWFFTIHGFYV
jgi:hypothetical protein